jgi:hypothetical protein
MSYCIGPYDQSLGQTLLMGSLSRWSSWVGLSFVDSNHLRSFEVLKYNWARATVVGSVGCGEGPCGQRFSNSDFWIEGRDNAISGQIPIVLVSQTLMRT